VSKETETSVKRDLVDCNASVTVARRSSCQRAQSVWTFDFGLLCVFITAVPIPAPITKLFAFSEPPVCEFITAVPITKLFAWGQEDSGGHVLRETTSRGLSGLVCQSRTSERGEEGDCVKEGGGGEGEREKEHALGSLTGCHYATALDIGVLVFLST
jgi:hypothetical protein